MNAEPSDFATIVRVRLGMPAQLAADPVFRHSPESVLAGGGQTRAELDRLLARGVPALSGPVGSRPFSRNVNATNVDMDARKIHSGWPRATGDGFSGWRHSDIKNVALPFIRSVLSDLFSGSGQ